MFAVGCGTIMHYDGSTWSEMEGAIMCLFGVGGASSSDVYAVGAEGTILHYDGAVWTEIESGISVSGKLTDVWCGSQSDVYAVGGSSFTTTEPSGVR